MRNGEFLSQLSGHLEAGRLDEASFNRIQKHELAKSDSASTEENSEPTQLSNDGASLRFKDNAMRFSLGVVAAIGATLVLIGFGLLASLIDDAIGLDIVTPLFALVACLAYFAPRLDVSGRAMVFVGEARAIIFGAASMISVVWFLGEIIDKSRNENFGPLNIFEWAPTLLVALASIHFARQMEAWVAYCAGWILWFYPMAFAIEQASETYAFICLMVVMGVLFAELWREWFAKDRTPSFAIQAAFHSMMLGIMAWVSLFIFEEAFDNSMLMALLYVVGWFVWMKVFPEKFSSRDYSQSSLNTSWPSILGVLVFYTGVPLYAGFTIGDSTIEEIGIGGFDISSGFLFGILFHGLMGLQMFGWKAANVVIKPSLTEPGTFAGSVFFIMAFVWFIFGLIDFLEDLAGYIFLPMGLLVLVLGTKRLMTGSTPEQGTEDSENEPLAN